MRPPSIDQAPRITIDEVRQLQARGEQPVFVDVRSAEDFAQQRIAGAIHVPLREVLRRHSELPPDRWIVFY
ncbi:MAG: hypothetical protein HYY04_05420 [Chloroflexi bacterium]|nr:hypothetical protein [Chloroflexota bacterium]